MTSSGHAGQKSSQWEDGVQIEGRWTAMADTMAEKLAVEGRSGPVKVNLPLRLMMLAMIYADDYGNARFDQGEIEGIVKARRTSVSDAIADAIEGGLLDPGSDCRLLVLPYMMIDRKVPSKTAEKRKRRKRVTPAPVGNLPTPRRNLADSPAA